MTDASEDRTDKPEIALEYELDAAPEKVWRAITTPAFREQWLPGGDLAEPDPIASVPGSEVRYRLRADDRTSLESTVTFRVEPGDAGKTLFKILHRIEGPARARSVNDNRRALSLAA